MSLAFSTSTSYWKPLRLCLSFIIRGSATNLFYGWHKYLNINLLLCIYRMPFYAVAVGRIPGVYKTWDECQNQTKGYPQAKFRKFNTEREASEFIQTLRSKSAELSFDASATTSTSVENLKPPELKALGKYSSQTLLKQDKLSLIAEKLDSFIEQTNKTLTEFGRRLDRLEAGTTGCNSSEGKRNADYSDVVEDIIQPKKQKTSMTVNALDDGGTRKSNRRKSKSSNGDIEEVDGPWRSNNSNSTEGFLVDREGFTIVFTDGACANNGKLGAKAGVGVWFNHNHPFNVAAPVNGNATNNNAEIQAASRAIEQASLAGIRRLNIHTDSQFMINCMTDWIKKWKKNNWMTTAGGPVKNKEQLILLDNALQNMDAVKWTHIRGHMGNEGNECADALARSGAAMYK